MGSLFKIFGGRGQIVGISGDQAPVWQKPWTISNELILPSELLLKNFHIGSNIS